jgi:sphinganine-1-phosphate aldolase
MADRGWHIDRQQRPPCIHLMINPGHETIVEAYLADLREAVAWVRAHPGAELSGSAPAYGLIAKAPVRGMIEKNVREMMEAMYGPEGRMPDLSADGGGVPAPLMALLRLKHRIQSFLNW